MKWLTSLFHAPVPRLPPIRETSEILSDLDRQVIRLASIRGRAAEMIKKLDVDDNHR